MSKCILTIVMVIAILMSLLTLSMLGKNFSRRQFKIFFIIFFPENRV